MHFLTPKYFVVCSIVQLGGVNTRNFIFSVLVEITSFYLIISTNLCKSSDFWQQLFSLNELLTDVTFIEMSRADESAFELAFKT